MTVRLACVVVGALLVTAQAADGARFESLGALPGGSGNVQVRNIAGSGFVAVGNGFGQTGTEAFRWVGGGDAEGLGFLRDQYPTSMALAASSDNTTIVGESLNDRPVYEAFRWTEQEGMIGLGTPSDGDYSTSVAIDVSADGSAIVGYAQADLNSGLWAFRWTEQGGMVDLDVLPGGMYARARAVSADGTVVVGDGKSGLGGDEAFRWTEGVGVTLLGDLPGGDVYAVATDISADGLTIVGTSDSAGGPQAYRWTEDEDMVGLGFLPGGDLTRAYSVSADGRIIVGLANSPATAFIWDSDNGTRELKEVLENEYDLDLTGWVLAAAQGVSDDGLVIVGTGWNPTGTYESWIVNLRDFLGDMDLDTDVDFDDIDDFVMALQSEATYEATYGVPATLHGDMDGSGNLDFDDIDDFVAKLNGSLVAAAESIPEPSSGGLALLAGLLALAQIAATGRIRLVR